MASIQLIPHNTNINFTGFRFVTFSMALIVLVASIGGMLIKGLNYGIDFRGGYSLEVRAHGEVNVAEMRESLSKLGLGEVMIQEFGKEKDLMIKVERHSDDEGDQENAISKIKQTLGTSVDYRKIATVGPKVGGELVQNGLKAVAFALIAMLAYIAFRFEWQFAICAILALAHDCIAILGLFSLFPNFEFNETAIIAILITAGYSINDTIVIFDRIRENIRRFKRLSLAELIDKSLNETLSRTIMTASTTLLALLALYFAGGKVISTFSLPIIIGIIIGSFSSICLAAPMLLYLNLKTGDAADREEKIVGSI
jgi:preprotein translocase subunit SecF